VRKRADANTAIVFRVLQSLLEQLQPRRIHLEDSERLEASQKENKNA
jgi:hypothetical protein